MRTIIRSALVALALSGAAALSTGSAEAQGSVGFYIGPSGVHVDYRTGYYYDRFHRRHLYRYPVDWRRYHYPIGWYQTHPYWYRDRTWYRVYDRYNDRYRDYDRYRRY